ncbi:MAG: hypothetical protein ACD_3C00105G0015 [uncultured bacterium (gcode 4)]|uniref:Fibrobacter succinogenes major paralogous domain-containing protein n=1 Tax=uncultured bacterium (gcode 4) TaxID=1234023 RepID=K2G1I8_9BACT|nr:MAG: hypothetical protein ACD_3C00105G0015 [uncultured bacterium (gcode 4)]
MRIKNNRSLFWFTLVELIVVIVILAILATIAFFSFNSQSSAARNSTRLSDLRNISKALELTKTNAWKYPNPSSWKLVSFSWAEIWTQGTFWQSTQRASSSISKAPVDPLFNVEYTYSTLNSDVEYQLSATMENKQMARNKFVPFNHFLEAHAAWENLQAMTIGTYNWMTAKVFTWWVYYILAIPSIISSNPPSSINDWVWIYLSVDGQWNLPDSYLNSNLTMTWGWVFQIKVVMTSANLNFSSWQVIQMAKNLQNAYTWTTFASIPVYQNLLQINPADTTALLSFSTNIVSNELGWGLTWTWIVTTFTLTPTSVQVWNTSSITDNCSTHPTSYVSSNTAVATIAWTTITWVSSWTTNITKVWWNCDDSAAKSLNVTPSPIVQWKDIAWTNCTKPDITIGWLTWAWCNSTLGTMNTISLNSYSWSCLNYNGSSAWVVAWCQGSSTKENWTGIVTWTEFTPTQTDNIYGKLYKFDTDIKGSWKCNTETIWWQTVYGWWDCACPSWWHIPSDSEFTQLSTALYGSACEISRGWQCTWLGWRNQSTRTNSNNIIKALWIPLAGRCEPTYGCFDRWNVWNFWTSTQTYSAWWYFYRSFGISYDTVNRDYKSGSNVAYSVRCVKDY